MNDPIQPEAAPVSGELVNPPDATVIPSTAEQNAAADRARGRTTQQVAIPTALVVVLVWLARLKGLDLNPIPGEEEIPAEVATSLAGLLAVLLAFRMNPKH